ncbi:rod shape-determining protein MreD [Chlorobaculum sp. MV4-Y]|uniref:rod shape-determining protein MreD n=1 Tax=Chlorobaculum sp. MV4-Y TaxID=2976335 RepID=UPI0021AF318D|nr:rod shape-determining protein MreD [Chlorobaculum sp. MV4-Y]UWX57058.1 rod shape-determining protein MreD [Chlorobaculum sp. MV4-Y]
MNKYLLYTIAVIILAFVQRFLVSKLLILHVSPDILAIFIAFISMSTGQRTGTNFGFGAGLVAGVLSGDLGLSALLGTAQGFVAGFFHVPQESHATSVKKKRMFYAASATALIAGNLLQSLLSDPLSLPLYVRIPETVILGTLMSMMLTVLLYHFALKKLLKD